MKTIDISKYELIIFDCDGTLVDSEALSNGVIAEMMRELGIQITNEEAFREFSGTSFQNITNYIEKTTDSTLDFDFEKRFRSRVSSVFEEHLQSIEGVEDLLSQISKKVCVASNGPKVKMMETLAITKLLQYFNKGNMFSAYDIQKWKPEPDLFLLAAEKMGVPPSKSLVIEDTIAGAMGAINAKIDVLVIIGDEDPTPFNKRGITTFRRFSQLIT